MQLKPKFQQLSLRRPREFANEAGGPVGEMHTRILQRLAAEEQSPEPVQDDWAAKFSRAMGPTIFALAWVGLAFAIA